VTTVDIHRIEVQRLMTEGAQLGRERRLADVRAHDVSG